MLQGSSVKRIRHDRDKTALALRMGGAAQKQIFLKFIPCGEATPHEDGKGFDIEMDAMPLNWEGFYRIRPKGEKLGMARIQQKAAETQEGEAAE